MPQTHNRRRRNRRLQRIFFFLLASLELVSKWFPPKTTAHKNHHHIVCVLLAATNLSLRNHGISWVTQKILPVFSSVDFLLCCHTTGSGRRALLLYLSTAHISRNFANTCTATARRRWQAGSGHGDLGQSEQENVGERRGSAPKIAY